MKRLAMLSAGLVLSGCGHSPPTRFYTLDAVAIAADVRAGVRSARDVIEATLHRIDQLDTQFNSFTTITANRARKAAIRIDARIAASERANLAKAAAKAEKLAAAEGKI